MAAFSSVDLAGSSGVTIRVGAPQSVVVHADDNLLARVTRVRAGTLVIGTRGSFTTSSSPDECRGQRAVAAGGGGQRQRRGHRQ